MIAVKRPLTAIIDDLWWPAMRLENAFTVPAPVEQAWSVLLDVERVAPCLPGAALDGGDGNAFTGTMTIKLGPVTSRYGGTVRIEEADATARRAVLRAQARDARGDGTAAATITTQLEPDGDGTRVQVVTDMQVSGPAAQFGRGVMQDVSGKLMRQFADCLAEEIGAGPARAAAGERAAAAAATTPAGYEETRVGRLPLGPAGDAAIAAAARRDGGGPRRSPDVLDLGAASRGALAKRVLPLAAVAAAAAAAAIAIRLRRRR
jgi:carbon monoxide dehydrogenase subunit G